LLTRSAGPATAALAVPAAPAALEDDPPLFAAALAAVEEAVVMRRRLPTLEMPRRPEETVGLEVVVASAAMASVALEGRAVPVGRGVMSVPSRSRTTARSRPPAMAPTASSRSRLAVRVGPAAVAGPAEAVLVALAATA